MFCESYPGLAYVLHRLWRREPDRPATIVVPVVHDLYDFLKALNETAFRNRLNVIYVPHFERRRSRWGRAVLSFADALAERRYLRAVYQRHFSTLRDAEITFSSPGYLGEKVYLLSRLAKRNRLVYIDPGPPAMGSDVPRSVREVFRLLLNQIRYGGATRLGEYPRGKGWDRGFPVVPDSFMKNVAGVVDWSDRDEVMRSFDWKSLGTWAPGEFEVMYFHQDLPRSAGIVIKDESTFSARLREIFEVVLRYFPEDRIARKYHPAHKNNQLVRIGTELPTFVPAEFLYRDSVRLYLGFDSTALTHARGAGKVVSLIDLISFEPEWVRQRLKGRLVKTSYARIDIPQSMAEFEDLVRGARASSTQARVLTEE